jgi:diaminohydroxyphosphoribosylaminopyrimidine deaminase/5-amino-6-(5-phosphoribosylamino)uracil reductase
MSELERGWMLRALETAERGRGHVEPNPLVGAVLVREGQVVGEGWHERYGQAHAEVNALRAAGPAAHGATLYVTLEPCCHHGKTPPCTEAVLRAGVTRVVTALLDPFPEVAGKGASCLRAAGVPVEIGLCAAEAQKLNAPYLKLLATGRPYVIAKWAMTLDGKIATRTGDSKWISGAASRRPVHELRGRMDAIVVGIGTVLADDPLLTARPLGPRTATRVVLDTQGRLPRACRLAGSAAQAPLLVATGGAASPGETLVLPLANGRVSVPALLDELGRRRMTNVLVEGGGEVLGSFLDAGAVDEVWAFIAPMVIGGPRCAVAGQGVARLADGLQLVDRHVELIDGDVLVTGKVQPR